MKIENHKKTDVFTLKIQVTYKTEVPKLWVSITFLVGHVIFLNNQFF